jgi:MFS family permease
VKVERDISLKSSKLGKKAQILLLAVLLALSFRNMGLSIVDIGLPSFIIGLSGSLVSYGIVIGIFSIMQSIFQFPIAASSDKWGRRTIVLIAMMVYITGTFLCFFAQNILQLIIFRAIQGIGAYTSILQAIIGDIFKKEKHGKGMGFYSLAINIGYFGGILLGGYISSFLGFRHIFSISGFLILCSTIFLMGVFNNNSKEEIHNDASNPTNPEMLSLKRENVVRLLKNRQINITIVLNSTRWFIFGGIVAYLIWVMQNYFNIDEIMSSYYLILIVSVYVSFVIISSKILDRQGPRKMMLIGQTIAISFGIFFFFDFSRIFPVFLVLTLGIGAGLALYDPAGATLLLNKIVQVDANLKGSGIGFNNAIGFFFGALGPIFICGLGEIDVFFPFYLIFALIVFAFLTTWKLIKVPTDEKREER